MEGVLGGVIELLVSSRNLVCVRVIPWRHSHARAGMLGPCVSTDARVRQFPFLTCSFWSFWTCQK